ncbi:unnamed protein product, partial [Iphiclides podalirius]
MRGSCNFRQRAVRGARAGAGRIRSSGVPEPTAATISSFRRADSNANDYDTDISGVSRRKTAAGTADDPGAEYPSHRVTSRNFSDLAAECITACVITDVTAYTIF